MNMNDDAIEGYLDGFRDSRDSLPDSLANRSHAYRVAWENGRDDRKGQPRTTAARIRGQMNEAERKDVGI